MSNGPMEMEMATVSTPVSSTIEHDVKAPHQDEDTQRQTSPSKTKEKPVKKKTRRTKNVSGASSWSLEDVDSEFFAGFDFKATKKQVLILFGVFCFLYLLIGLLLYRLVTRLRMNRQGTPEPDQDAWSLLQQQQEAAMQEQMAMMQRGNSPNEMLPPELMAMLGGGMVPPGMMEGGTIRTTKMFESPVEGGGVRVRIRVRVKKSTSFRGGRGDSVEDMFKHDPFLQMLMGGAVKNLEEDMHHLQHPALPGGGGPADDNTSTTTDSPPPDASETGGPSDSELLQSLAMGGRLPMAPGVTTQRIVMSDGDGHHHIRIRIHGAEDALQAFFGSLNSVDDLTSSGALDSLFNDIARGMGEPISKETSGDQKSDGENKESGENKETGDTIKGGRRILVMASTEASDLEALKKAMAEKFQNFDHVDVQNFPTPKDFIEADSLRSDGYHSMHDLGLLPKIMHTTEMPETSVGTTDEEKWGGSAVSSTLSSFCQRISMSLVCPKKSSKDEAMKEQNFSDEQEKDHKNEGGCEFTSVNKVKPEILDDVIANVQTCKDVFGSLEKSVERTEKYVKSKWSSGRDRSEI